MGVGGGEEKKSKIDTHTKENVGSCIFLILYPVVAFVFFQFFFW